MILHINAEFNGVYHPAGKIETLPGIGGVFSYDEAWVEEGPALPLSLSLPLNSNEYPDRSIRPYFEGLLPEEHSRRVIARELGVSNHSYLKILAALGNECIGAVLISPEGESEFARSYTPLTTESFEKLAAREYSLSSEIAAESRLSLAGAQSKVGLYRDQDGSWWIPHGTAPSNCIVKPNNSRFAGLVDNELFCLNIARACGIPTASAAKASTSAPMLIVERYDRMADSTNLIDGHRGFRRLHQEDFCQALGIFGTNKYEETPGNYAGKMADLLRKYSSNPMKSISQLFSLIALNYFIGNCDAHLKNYSIIRSSDWNELTLSPAYDLVSTTVYPELSSNMGLYIGHRKKLGQIERDDFIDMAKAMRIRPKAADVLLDEMRENLALAFEQTGAETAVTQTIAMQTKNRIEQLA